MSDDEIRELTRAAEADASGASWVRVGAQLQRLGRLEEAGTAALRARTLGVSASELLDGLAPDLDGLALRPLHELPEIRGLAWSPDEAHVHVTSGRRIVTIARDGSSVREHALPAAPRGVEILALAREPAGTRLALALSDRYGVETLAVLERAAGAVPAPIALPKAARVSDVAFAGESIVGAESSGALAYALPVSARAKPVWTLDAIGVDFDLSGALVGTVEERLVVRRPGDAAPTTLDFDVPELPGRRVKVARGEGPQSYASLVTHVRAAGYRVLVVAKDEVLRLDEHGQVDLRAPLPPKKVLARNDPLGAAPSGRFLAFRDLARDSVALVVLDLVTGKARKLTLPERPERAVWSPSGRRLAVVTKGTVSLLE